MRRWGPEGAQPQELILHKNHPSWSPAPPSQRRAHLQLTPRPKPVVSTQSLRQSLALFYPPQSTQDSAVECPYHGSDDLTETTSYLVPRASEGPAFTGQDQGPEAECSFGAILREARSLCSLLKSELPLGLTKGCSVHGQFLPVDSRKSTFYSTPRAHSTGFTSVPKHGGAFLFQLWENAW